MTTPTPGDLSARLPELPEPELMTIKGRAFTATQMYLFAIKVRDAALSALPAAGGEVCRVCGGGPGNFGVCLCGEHDYTTPQPSAAEPKCGCGRPGEYESKDGPACNKYFRCKDAAVGAQGDGWLVVEAWVHGGKTAELKLQRAFRGDDESVVLDLSGQRISFASHAAPAAGRGVDERTRFIAWANQRGMVAFDCEAAFGMEADDRFISPDTSLAWAAWQAALTRQPVAGDGMVLVGWASRKQIDRLRTESDLTGIMVHDEKTDTINVPMFAAPAATPTCAHEWVSGDNKYVNNMLICQRCYEIRPAATPTDGGEG